MACIYSKLVVSEWWLCLVQDGTPTTKTFEHVASEIGAEEAEEVGVEHLLRYLSSFHCATRTISMTLYKQEMRATTLYIIMCHMHLLNRLKFCMLHTCVYCALPWAANSLQVV